MTNETTRHFIYDRFLRKCCRLSDADRRGVRARWGLGDAQMGALLLRSMPDEIDRLFGLEYLTRTFPDLRGVAGFYAKKKYDEGTEDIPSVKWRRAYEPVPVPVYTWALNLPASGLLRPYRNEHSRICGLIVYRGTADREPRLLTSRLFPLGSKAVPYNPLYESEIILHANIRVPSTKERAGHRAGTGEGREASERGGAGRGG